MMNIDLNRIKQAVEAVPEIAACYLFGSAAGNDIAVNDLDLLILVRPEADAQKVIWDLTGQVSERLSVSADCVDVLVFDPQHGNPEVLYRAVTEGILLKNERPDLLGTQIETLSQYFLENDYLMAQADWLRQALIEEFAVNGQIEG